MKVNRVLIAAPKSGSGKTLITCGLLGACMKRGLKTASFKCGPDFIDPMFHTKVIGTKSRNLDTFFAGEDTTRMLLMKNAADSDIAIMEGVMGYFDGISLDNGKAGASDLASVTDTPVILVVDAAAAGRSVLAMIKGFLDFEEKKCIKGVILNRISPMLYGRMKEQIEKELPVQVVGYVPVLKDCILESRHLGLMMPDEIKELKEKLDVLSDTLEKSLDMDAILKLATDAPEIFCEKGVEKAERILPDKQSLRIGVARDEAFCFFYADNLTLLEEMGAELIPFSPIHDEKLPEKLDGLLFHGGYPELYVKQLSENKSMRESIRDQVNAGLPCMAECGGFLYLHEIMEDMEGNAWPQVGLIKGKAFYTGRLSRFGYTILKEGSVFGMNTGEIRSHEFHYYDSEHNGEAFLAVKPTGARSWRCINQEGTLFAGFPHLYYYANQKVPYAFLKKCAEGK